MREFRCDICGASVGEFKLQTLVLPVKRAPDIGIPDIDHACDTCVRVLDGVNENMKRAMDMHRKAFLRDFTARLWRRLSRPASESQS